MGSAPSAPAPEKTNKGIYIHHNYNNQLINTTNKHADGVADLRGKHSEGKRVPHVVFRTRVRDDTIQPNPFKWLDLTTDEIFKVHCNNQHRNSTGLRLIIHYNSTVRYNAHQLHSKATASVFR